MAADPCTKPCEGVPTFHTADGPQGSPHVHVPPADGRCVHGHSPRGLFDDPPPAQPVRPAAEAELREAVHQALYDQAVDHPMWIDGKGQPLDYTPEREIRIGDFLDAATDALLSLLADRGLLDAARKVEAVEALHVEDDGGWCRHCGAISRGDSEAVWPCTTRRALDSP